MFNILSVKYLMVQHFYSRVGCGHQMHSSSHSICCGFGSSGRDAAGGLYQCPDAHVHEANIIHIYFC